eukprot:c9409_g1_i2.p2 GENE.c9409_g1_i2~~c9409_g1_i2.p2  ORF type:complete len:126 (-),score=22.21 c9409_g1_i2:196-573(-)
MIAQYSRLIKTPMIAVGFLLKILKAAGPKSMPLPLKRVIVARPSQLQQNGHFHSFLLSFSSQYVFLSSFSLDNTFQTRVLTFILFFAFGFLGFDEYVTYATGLAILCPALPSPPHSPHPCSSQLF